MQLHNRILSIVLAAIVVLLLAACEKDQAMEKEMTTSSSTSPSSSQTNATETKEANSFIRIGSFESNDRKITFNWNISSVNEETPLPVLTAVPHYFSGNDIQQIANALFDDAEYYDLGPKSSRQLSKAEIENRIALLEPYLDENQRKNTLHSIYTELAVQTQLDTYLNAYTIAPEQYNYQVCDWILKSEGYYNDTNSSVLGSGNTNKLEVLAVTDVSDYYISVSVENANKYQRNNISIQAYDGTDPVLRDIKTASMCQLTEPTSEQIDAVSEKAQNILNSIGLGEYAIIEVKETPLTYGMTPRYAISVKATQVMNGCPVISEQSTITSGVDDLNTDSNNEARYPLTYIRFIFNPSGDLIEFTMEGITDIESVNCNVSESISLDSLCVAAENYLSKLDFDSFDALSGNNAWELALFSDVPMDRLRFSVEINDMQFGLARQDSPTKNIYEYLPVAMLRGTISCIDSEGDALREYQRALALISTIDGTII